MNQFIQSILSANSLSMSCGRFLACVLIFSWVCGSLFLITTHSQVPTLWGYTQSVALLLLVTLVPSKVVDMISAVKKP